VTQQTQTSQITSESRSEYDYS